MSRPEEPRDGPLTRAFTAAASVLAEGSHDGLDARTDVGGDGVELESALTRAHQTASERWPAVAVDAAAFAAFLGERLGHDPDPVGSIECRATDDLFLVCACASGDATALSIIEKQCFAGLPQVLARLKIESATAEEVLQAVREKLLVARDGRLKLLDYLGTGDLRGWVKVIAVRAALRAARHDRRRVELTDELVAALPSPALSPELQYLKERYSDSFRTAFAAAIEELEPRERSLLRQSIIYRSTVDQISNVYGVHRATAARWVARARERLAERTRSILCDRLSVSTSQYESIARLVESQIDLSVERLLASDETDA